MSQLVAGALWARPVARGNMRHVGICALWMTCLLLLPQFASAAERHMQAGDKLLVVVPEAKEDGTEGTVLREIRGDVDENGEVALGLYGRVRVAGLSESVAAALIRKRLAKFVHASGAISVVVEARRIAVLVTGRVMKPGPLPVREDADPWQAIQLAGGMDQGADLQRVRLTREGVAQVLDVHGWLLARDAKPLPRLQAGDEVFVPAAADLATQAGGLAGMPATDAVVHVFGYIRNPGQLPVTGPVRLVDLIARAGGPADHAQLAEVHVVHSNGRASFAAQYDVQRFLENGGAVGRVMVAPGDLVWVGTRDDAMWRQALAGLSNAALLAAAIKLLITL